MLFKNHSVYDILKWIAMVVLPATPALLEGLNNIWNIPYGTQIVATISVINVFLGTLLQVSSRKYKKQTLANEQ